MSKIRFPEDMPKAPSVADGDKMMLADASTNEAKHITFDQAKQYFTIEGQRIAPIAPGALPAGPTGQTRYMEVTAVGSWTYGGNTFTNADGYKTLLWWNGTTWSNAGSAKIKGDAGVNGKTIENYSNTVAYSIGSQVFFNDTEIYEALSATVAGESPTTTPSKWALRFQGKDNIVEDILEIEGAPIGQLDKLISMPASRGNTTPVGYAYFQYKNNSFLEGRTIKRITIDVSAGGPMGVYKIKYSDTTPEITLISTITTTIGLTSYDITPTYFGINESLAVIGPDDTSRIKYANGVHSLGGKLKYIRLSDNVWIESDNNASIDIYADGEGFQSSVIEKIDNNLEALNTLIPYSEISPIKAIVSPSIYTSAASTSYRYYHYQNSSSIQGKKVVAIRVNPSTVGTLSIYKIKNKGLETQTISFVQTLTLSSGSWTHEVDIDVAIDEIIAFRDTSDTASFYYNNAITNSVGSNIVYMNSSNNWVTLANSDLGIGIDVVDRNNKLSVINDIRKLNSLFGKKVSFLGDSITTFNAWISLGNASYYPRYEVNTVNDTWWKKLIDVSDAEIDVNNSWSGSKVSGTDASAFNSRTSNIGNPDVLFIFGGTNDFNASVSLGTISLTGPFDKATFTGAYQQMLVDILTSNPLTRIICMTPMRRGNVTTPVSPDLLDAYCDRIIEICKLYGIEWIDMRYIGITPINRLTYMPDHLHPNKEGMERIFNYISSKIG